MRNRNGLNYRNYNRRASKMHTRQNRSGREYFAASVVLSCILLAILVLSIVGNVFANRSNEIRERITEYESSHSPLPEKPTLRDAALTSAPPLDTKNFDASDISSLEKYLFDLAEDGFSSVSLVLENAAEPDIPLSTIATLAHRACLELVVLIPSRELFDARKTDLLSSLAQKSAEDGADCVILCGLPLGKILSEEMATTETEETAKTEKGKKFLEDLDFLRALKLDAKTCGVGISVHPDELSSSGTDDLTILSSVAGLVALDLTDLDGAGVSEVILTYRFLIRELSLPMLVSSPPSEDGWDFDTHGIDAVFITYTYSEQGR